MKKLVLLPIDQYERLNQQCVIQEGRGLPVKDIHKEQDVPQASSSSSELGLSPSEKKSGNSPSDALIPHVSVPALDATIPPPGVPDKKPLRQIGTGVRRSRRHQIGNYCGKLYNINNLE